MLLEPDGKLLRKVAAGSQNKISIFTYHVLLALQVPNQVCQNIVIHLAYASMLKVNDAFHLFHPKMLVKVGSILLWCCKCRVVCKEDWDA